MAYQFNPFTGNFDYYAPSDFRGVLTSDPSDPVEGNTYINSNNHTRYIYYAGVWQAIQVLYFPSSGVSGSPMGLLLSLTYP